MHIHTKFSDHPSEWFLQRLGAKESYVEPDAVYESAIKAGMDFVTLTDHNQIEGIWEVRSFLKTGLPGFYSRLIPA